MKTRTPIVAAFAVVLAIVAAAAVVWLRPRPADHVPDVAHEEHPTRPGSLQPEKQSALPDPVGIASAGAADDWSDEITIDQLLDALRKAAENMDSRAVGRLRAMLSERDPAEVGSASRERLAAIPTDDAALGESRGLITYLGNLVYFVAAIDLGGALERLRAAWSLPRMAETGAQDRWIRTDAAPVSYLARQCLSKVEEIQAIAVATALTDGLTPERKYRTRDLVMQLGGLFSKGVPEGEVPDPWLSAIVSHAGERREKMHPQGWAAVRECLTTLHRTDGISQRLRAQIAVYLVTTPGGFWDLAEAVSGAMSSEEIGRALLLYLQFRSLTREEVEFLLAVLAEKFKTEGPERSGITESVVAREREPHLTAAWSEFARTLLEAAATNGNRDHAAIALDMLAGVSRRWHPLPKQRDRFLRADTAMLPADSIERLVALFKSLWGKGTQKDRHKTFRANRVIAQIWMVNCSLAKQIQGVEMILDEFDKLPPELWVGVGRIATFSKRYDPVLHVDATTSARIVGLLSRLLADVQPVLPSRRPIPILATERDVVMLVVDLLESPSFPELGELAVRNLLVLARAVIDDGIPTTNSTQAPLREHVTRSIDSAQKLVLAYGHRPE